MSIRGDHTCSVVIVNWNTRALVIRCIEHLLASDSGSPLEVIVADNGSSDGSADEIERRFPTVRVMRLGTNTGFVAANNRAWPETTGDTVFFVNPDTEVHPGAIARLLTALWTESHRGIVGGRLLFADGTDQISCFPFPRLRDIMLEHLVSATLYRWVEVRRFRRTSTGPVEVIRGADLMIRRSVLETVGGFDPRLFMYAEETDLCRRVRDLGWVVWYEPSAVITHFERRSMVQQLPEEVAYQYLRSKWILVSTHFTGRRRAAAVWAIRAGVLLRGLIAPFVRPQAAPRLRRLLERLDREFHRLPVEGKTR